MASYYRNDYSQQSGESPDQFKKRDWPGAGEYPPPAFYFSVKFPGLEASVDTSFQEVSGISQEMDLEETTEGGENRVTYYLPKHPKYQKLVLKRGVVPMNSALIKWCKSVLDGAFPIATGNVEISLMNFNGSPIRTWTFDGAYPVKWQVDGFNSTKNEVAIETIELCYQSFSREM